MSVTEMSITNPKKQLEFYKQLTEQLQQENKQLKEDLKRYKQIYRENPTLYDEIAPYIIRECELENKINLYKSVIDEISEYEENSSFDVDTRDFGRLTVCDADELALILDKANIKESE